MYSPLEAFLLGNIVNALVWGVAILIRMDMKRRARDAMHEQMGVR